MFENHQTRPAHCWRTANPSVAPPNRQASRSLAGFARIAIRVRRPATLRMLLLICVLLGLAAPAQAQQFAGSWISTSADSLTKPNTWHCFRKTVRIGKVPPNALLRLAADSKYWLYINGKMAVYEGSLKRGPNPRDTYYDEVDIAPFLKRGRNTVAVLVWFWGGRGFTHKNSGRCGLYADCAALGLASGSDWKARQNPAYQPSQLPKPNFRLSEPNIRHDAGVDEAFAASARPRSRWYANAYDDSAWPVAVKAGPVPVAPWNALVKRPIPMFKDFGIHDYVSVVRRPGPPGTDTLVCRLPYSGHFSPVLKVRAKAGRRIFMGSDTYYMGALSPTDSLYTIGSEYITKNGVQTYESFGWMSGHEIRYVLPSDVRVVWVRYRETGYNAAFAGSFSCSDPLLTRLWQKAQRTLYVNMRDNYMDCPDRERAQWAGDGALEMAQAFYALDTNSFALSRKLYLDLANWQRPDSVIYNPVPEDDWKSELPAHGLMPLSELERYFRHTHDTATVRHVYPALRRYLAVWKQQTTGQLVYRKGGWDWGDWGENQDLVLIQHGWYVRALQTAQAMARLLHYNEDAAWYGKKIAAITSFLNGPDCWNGVAYHHKSHTGKTDDRANSLMVLAGVADSAKWGAVARVLAQQEHASPWMEKFVLESLFRMKRPQQALDRMRRRYRAMTESAFSTLWELWRYELSEAHGNTGYNHAWAGGPLVLMSEYIAGVSPSNEKENAYFVWPLLTDITQVEATVPTKQGPLRVNITRTDGNISLTLDVPPNTTVSAALPVTAEPFVFRSLDGREWPADNARKSSGTVVVGFGRHILQGRTK